MKNVIRKVYFVWIQFVASLLNVANNNDYKFVHSNYIHLIENSDPQNEYNPVIES